MDERPYGGISELLAAGATLAEVEACLQRRTEGRSEEERSAIWLQDWHAWEHLNRLPGDSGPSLRHQASD